MLKKMKKQNNKVLFVGAFLSVLFFFIFGLGEVKAGIEHNVWGWAWSSNIGWISFNNTSGGGSINYGVHITEKNPATGIFSGYAYYDIDDPNTPVDETGWISFNRSDTGSPPGEPDYGTYLAQVDFQTGEVSGWARALFFGSGWDGWIKLKNHADDWGEDYGIYINKNTGDFHGWAWGYDVISWISFNCQDQGICGQSNYKVETSFVFNHPPNKPLPVGEGETWQHCAIQALSIPTFEWTYSDPENDPQAGYEIRIDNDSDFLVVDPEEFMDSGGGSTSYTPVPADWANYMDWDTDYWWIVRVQDDYENWSEWSDPDYFKTPESAYPWPDFSWLPARPALGESVNFTDESESYGGASIVSREWIFENGDPTYSFDNELFPITTFIDIGDENQNQVSLSVVDSNNNSCSLAKSVRIMLPLPEWKEISPF